MNYPKGKTFAALTLAALGVTSYGIYAKANLLDLAACLMASLGVVTGGGMVNRWADLRDTLKSQAPSSSSSSPSR